MPIAAHCTSRSASPQCEKYDVEGFPAVKYFHNGKFHSEYNGDRKVRADCLL